MNQLSDIPGYRIEAKLGEGGMASVYFGVQKKLNRKVAIKIMDPLLLKDDNFARRFLKEAETAANLIHPNIVTIYDVGEWNNKFYMVMEYLEGTLKKKIGDFRENGTPFPINLALQIIVQIGNALDYAHERGYIHRDIKPDNIMFRNGQTPVLVDFGIAKAVGMTTKLTRTGISIGTPHYMSPEQIRGQEVDGRADFYSLGVLFFEMLTGEVPYRATDYIAVVMKHINDPVPQLPDSTAEFQPLLELMMAKNKEDRLRSGKELGDIVKRIRTGSSPSPDSTDRRDARKTVAAEVDIKKENAKTELIELRLSEKQKSRRVWPAVATVLLLGVMAAGYFWGLPALTNRSDSEIFSTDKHKLNQGIASQKSDFKPVQQKIENKNSKTVPEIENKIPTAKKSDKPVSESEKVRDSVAPGMKKKEIPEAEKTGSGSVNTVPARIKEKESSAVNGTLSPRKMKKTKKILSPGSEQKTVTDMQGQDKSADAGKNEKEFRASGLKPVSIIQVSPQLVKHYNRMLDRIQVEWNYEDSKVLGSLQVTLSLTENGTIAVQKIYDTGLKVSKPHKFQFIRLFSQKMKSIKLTPPRDRQGHSVRITDWRLSFRVGTYAGKINLKRRY